MSLFIDLTEVRKILDRYEITSGTKLALEKPRVAALDSGRLPDLLRALDNKEATVRAIAAKALGDLRFDGQPAVSHLLKALHDPDELVRRFALESLNKIGAPDRSDAKLLIGALKDKDLEVRAYAARALGRLGPDGSSAVGALLEDLKDTEVAVRQNAAVALGKVGGDAKERVQPALMVALNDPVREVRAAAAEGLAALPMRAADVPALLGLIKHKDAEVREQGALGLMTVGPDAKAAVKPLENALQDPSARVRRASLQALAGVGPDARDAVPAVQKMLQDSDREVRLGALDVLGSVGPDARGATGAIVNALSDPDLRRAALATLKKIGPIASRAAVPTLVGILSNLTKEERLLAFDTLLALKTSGGPEGKDIMPEVIAVFGKVKALELLEGALSGTDHLVRLGAARALGEIGPDARSAAQVLETRAQTDRDAEVRAAGQRSLEKIRMPR
jgi:HEAT repeat protein